MLEIKTKQNTVTEMNAFDRLISRLDKTKERISELEDMATEMSKTEMQRGKKNLKTQNRILQNCSPISKDLHVIGIPTGEREWSKRNL